MIIRKYTATEIDLMRGCVRIIADLTTHLRLADPKIVEEQLRTYLQAGVDPTELFKLADTRAAERIEAERQRRQKQ